MAPADDSHVHRSEDPFGGFTDSKSWIEDCISGEISYNPSGPSKIPKHLISLDWSTAGIEPSPVMVSHCAHVLATAIRTIYNNTNDKKRSSYVAEFAQKLLATPDPYFSTLAETIASTDRSNDLVGVQKAAAQVMLLVCKAVDEITTCSCCRAKCFAFFVHMMCAIDLPTRTVSHRESGDFASSYRCYNQAALRAVLIDWASSVIKKTIKYYGPPEDTAEFVCEMLGITLDLSRCLRSFQFEIDLEQRSERLHAAYWAHVINATTNCCFELQWAQISKEPSTEVQTLSLVLPGLMCAFSHLPPTRPEALASQSPLLGDLCFEFGYYLSLSVPAEFFWANCGMMIDNCPRPRKFVVRHFINEPAVLQGISNYIKWSFQHYYAHIDDPKNRLVTAASQYEHFKPSKWLIERITAALKHQDEPISELYPDVLEEEEYLGVIDLAFRNLQTACQFVHALETGEDKQDHNLLQTDFIDLCMEGLALSMKFPEEDGSMMRYACAFVSIFDTTSFLDRGAQIQEKLNQADVMKILESIVLQCIYMEATEDQAKLFHVACSLAGHLCCGNEAVCDDAVKKLGTLLTTLAAEQLVRATRTRQLHWRDSLRQTFDDVFKCLYLIANGSAQLCSHSPGRSHRTSAIIKALNAQLRGQSGTFAEFCVTLRDQIYAGEDELPAPRHAFAANNSNLPQYMMYFAYEDYNRAFKTAFAAGSIHGSFPTLFVKHWCFLLVKGEGLDTLTKVNLFSEEQMRYIAWQWVCSARLQCAGFVEPAIGASLPPLELMQEVNLCETMLRLGTNVLVKWLAVEENSLPSAQKFLGKDEIAVCPCCYVVFQIHWQLAEIFKLVLTWLEDAVREDNWPAVAGAAQSCRDKLFEVRKDLASSKWILNGYLRRLGSRKEGIGGAFWEESIKRLDGIVEKIDKKLGDIGKKKEDEDAKAAADAAAAALLAELEAEEQQSKAENSKKRAKRQKQKEKQKAAKEAAAAEEKARKEAEEAAKREKEEKKRAEEEAKRAAMAAQEVDDSVEESATEPSPAKKKKSKKKKHQVTVAEDQEALAATEDDEEGVLALLGISDPTAAVDSVPEVIKNDEKRDAAAHAVQPSTPSPVEASEAETLAELLSLLLPSVEPAALVEEPTTLSSSSPVQSSGSLPFGAKATATLVPGALPAHSPLALCVAEPERWQALSQLLHCPVSGVPLFDPVIDTDGDSYDKKAGSQNARPNYALRQLLQELCGG